MDEYSAIIFVYAVPQNSTEVLNTGFYAPVQSAVSFKLDELKKKEKNRENELFLGVWIYFYRLENVLDNDFVSNRSICLHFFSKV